MNDADKFAKMDTQHDLCDELPCWECSLKKFENEQRLSEYCITCEEHKNIGLAVCWTCFKYIDNCWKDSSLELREWVEKVKPQQLYTSCTSCNWFGIPIFDGDAEEKCKQCQMGGTYEYGEYYTASKF